MPVVAPDLGICYLILELLFLTVSERLPCVDPGSIGWNFNFGIFERVEIYPDLPIILFYGGQRT